jgi:hypothetical protein
MPATIGPSDALTTLLRHSAFFSPYYSDQPWAARLRSGASIDILRDIPLTAKDLVRRNTEAFYSRRVPSEDREVHIVFTSGSTGEPMKIMRTALHRRMNALENMRLRAGWPLSQHRNMLDLSPAEKDKPIGLVEVSQLPNGSRMWRL